MLKRALLFTAALLCSAAAFASNYCDGYEAGYAEGYCYGDFGCIAPIAPLCPLPSINEDNTYRGGYNRGFIEGQRAKARSR